MAKKVSLPSAMPARPVPGNAPVEHGGVRMTPGGIHNPNVVAWMSDNTDQAVPIVDVPFMEAQDANDGTENGDQDSFKMPPFANGGKN